MTDLNTTIQNNSNDTDNTETNQMVGKQWSEQEDLLLKKFYVEDNLDIIKISELHQRTPGGIVARLVRNKIIQEKKMARGWEIYNKPTPITKPVAAPKTVNKTIPIKLPEEIIKIDEQEFILSGENIWGIKKIKDQILGTFDKITSVFTPFDSLTKYLIEFLKSRTELKPNVLLLGKNLESIKKYYSYDPNIIFWNDTKLLNDKKINVCVINNFFSSELANDFVKQILNNDVLNQQQITHMSLQLIMNLIDTNGDLVLFEESSEHLTDIITILKQNNYCVIEEKINQVFTIKKSPKRNFPILVVDTETTGLPSSWDFRRINCFDSARLIELGFILFDSNGNLVYKNSILIRPNGFTIENSHIHGISHVEAVEKGKSIDEVLNEFEQILKTVDGIVCHNITFDMNIIMSEAYRLKRNNLIQLIESKQKICTMEMGKKFMKFYKNPKLVELYKFIFNKEFNQEHRALSDCEACADCYFSM